MWLYFGGTLVVATTFWAQKAFVLAGHVSKSILSRSCFRYKNLYNLSDWFLLLFPCLKFFFQSLNPLPFLFGHRHG